MRIFVTGGTGLLGNTILRQLMEAGYELVSLVRTTPNQEVFQGIQTEFATGDVADRDAISRSVADCDAVIHSAGLIHIGWTRLEESMRVNRDGTRAIVDACGALGVPLVHVGSVNTLAIGTRSKPSNETTPLDEGGGQVPSSYVTSKRAGVTEVKKGIERGLRAVIVHPGFMLGPWDWKPSSGRMLLEIAKGWKPIAPSGGCCVCDSRDVASGTISAMHALLDSKIENGREFILGGENWTYFELWKEMAKRMGAGKPLMPAGPAQRWIGKKVGDAMSKLTSQEHDLNSAAVMMSSQFHWHDSSRARAELGYRSRDPHESLDAAAQWLRRHQN